MTMTNDAEKLALQFLLDTGTSPTEPTSLELALYTSSGGTPGESGTSGTEVSGGGYSRQAIDFTHDGSTSPTTVDNDSKISISATGSWGTVEYFVIWDAGNNVPLWYGSFNNPRSIDSGDTFEINANDLDLNLD